MSDRDIWIGIDLGTQSVRVLAVTGDGEVLSSGQAPLRSERREECHEQDPQEWWNALGEASRQATRTLENKHQIRALSVCGTSGTVPSLVAPSTAIGEVCREAAAHTGLPEGTPIIAGMTDGCASQLASGAVEAGSWNSVLGTTLVLKGKSPTLIRDPNGIVYSHRAPDGDWLPGGASSAGAGSFSRALGADADLDDLSARAQSRPHLPPPLYPLASGRGERFPFIAPDLSLDIPTTIANDPLEIYRSLTFGIAAVERLCFDYLASSGFSIDGDIALTGGGARNPALNRLRATMLNRALKIPAVAEPALGMALLASTMHRSFVEASRSMVRIAHIVEPNMAQHARLSDSYLTFIDHLQTRGWLPRDIADHARGRAA
jgi:sugar (pentulose or hexulose) kinase